MTRHLRELRGKWAGRVVWVLGSGPTLDHVAPRMFDRESVIACNDVARDYGLTGPDVISASNYELSAVYTTSTPLVTPAGDVAPGALPAECREPCPPDRLPPEHYTYDAPLQRYSAFDAATDWPDDPDALVTGPSSIHMCMHLAAYMGAATIILAGVDCGELDGRRNFGDYDGGMPYPYAVQRKALPAVADQLRARYGVGVHSLNPFVNLLLEGHEYGGG